VVGAAAPASWRKDGLALVEAIPSVDGSSKAVRGTISRVKAALPPTASLGGVAPEDRDFVHAVYGNFPYVLLFVNLADLRSARASVPFIVTSARRP